MAKRATADFLSVKAIKAKNVSCFGLFLFLNTVDVQGFKKNDSNMK